MNRTCFALVALSLFVVPATARADHLEACGGVYLEAEAAASCEFVWTEECVERCEPAATEKVCASRLTTTCEADCTLSADAACVTTCDESCVPSCTSESEPPNCMGLCMSDCQQDCTTACAASDDEGKCRSSCAQVCSNGCHDECDGEPATECTPLCETACTGSCDGRANLGCQVACQSDLYTECEDVVVQECRDECETSGGAIFCDGQFLATGSDPVPCAEELRDAFGAEVDVSVEAAVEGDADVDDDGAEGWARGLLSCTTTGAPADAALGMIALAGLAVARRRRVAR
jgi:MYXO-CTERM domain-containing protein